VLAKLAVSVAVFAGIGNSHGFELLAAVPVQLPNAYPEFGTAVSVISVCDR
jgi:hypothetical protein